MTQTVFFEYKGKINELDRSFDLAFWQAQSPEARFQAAWEMVVHYAKVKGLDVHQLRLQRSVETFQRQRHYDLFVKTKRIEIPIVVGAGRRGGALA